MGRFMSLIYDRFMRASEEACLEAWRTELLSGLSGVVLEIGAGTGANVTRYPAAVDRLVLIDDDPHMLARLEARVRTSGRDGIEIREANASALPFPDASFDAVVSTLVLWKHVAGNCHLTRRTGEAIRAAGFVIEDERRESMRKALPIVRPTVRGIARG